MISIIIGHRENGIERKENLEFLLQYYKNLLQQENFNYEIIIVEQDEIQKVRDSLFIYNKGLYNRSWGFNIGVKHAKYENILCIDNDIILPQDTFFNGLQQVINNKTVYVPYEWFIDFTKEQTKKFKEDINFNFKREELNERYGWTDSVHQFKYGGCFFVNKNFYLEVCGMEESCEGWGCEDESWFFKYSKILEPKGLDWNPRSKICSIYHLYHERTNMLWVRDQMFYKNNCKLMEKIRSMEIDDLLRYIEECRSIYFNENKYKIDK
jgi:glycosyltransferase involved in cell wall biosynthesis